MFHKCEIRCHKSRMITLTPEHQPLWAGSGANRSRPDRATQLAPAKPFPADCIEVRGILRSSASRPQAEIGNVRFRLGGIDRNEDNRPPAKPGRFSLRISYRRTGDCATPTSCAARAGAKTGDELTIQPDYSVGADQWRGASCRCRRRPRARHSVARRGSGRPPGHARGPR
jgi:hypothetical protein